MQQRRLDERTARKLLINAFMQDVVNTLSDEPLKEELRQQITEL